MSRDLAVILTDRPPPDWESTILVGSLLGEGISSEVRELPVQRSLPSRRAAILLMAPTAALVAECSDRHPPIVAGRRLTHLFLARRVHPDPRYCLVYGEPYKTVARLLSDPEVMREARGRAILGEPLDLEMYQTPDLDLPVDVDWPVLTSLGCEKRCGYCAYGLNFPRIYPQERRSRPWQAVADDLVRFANRTNGRFRLLADQVLSLDRSCNIDLFQLAKSWRGGGVGRLSLGFSVGPAEVCSNSDLLESLAEAFELRVSLSIDTLDGAQACMWHLAHDCASSLQAVSHLRRLGCSIRLNYIFIRPGLNLRRLRDELSQLSQLAQKLDDLEPQQQLMLCGDLFLRHLDVRSLVEYRLVDAAIGDYQSKLSPDVLRVIAKILEAMQEEASGTQAGRSSNPLVHVVEAGQREVDRLTRASRTGPPRFAPP
jgi:hypothetical protein